MLETRSLSGFLKGDTEGAEKKPTVGRPTDPR